MRAVYSLTQDLFSKEEHPINVIEVQKMKEQFYVMLRTGFERKLKNERVKHSD